jgi:hypothetical protein
MPPPREPVGKAPTFSGFPLTLRLRLGVVSLSPSSWPNYAREPRTERSESASSDWTAKGPLP